MQKILIIGSGGSGKSTFARRLGSILAIDVYHLDALYWRPGLVEPPKDEWLDRLRSLLSQRTWILDGNYSGTLRERLAVCDAVIFLDLPRLLCLWRVIARYIKYRNTTRPDMAAGCTERLRFQFLSWLWNYPTRNRPRVLQLLEEHAAGRTIVRLRSVREVERFLQESAEVIASAA